MSPRYLIAALATLAILLAIVQPHHANPNRPANRPANRPTQPTQPQPRHLNRLQEAEQDVCTAVHDLTGMPRSNCPPIR